MTQQHTLLLLLTGVKRDQVRGWREGDRASGLEAEDRGARGLSVPVASGQAVGG